MPRSSLPTLYVQPGFKLECRDHPDDPTMVFVSTVPGAAFKSGEVRIVGYDALVKASDVAALVKAAQAVVDVGFPTHDCEHGPAIDTLAEVLKRFTRAASDDEGKS